MLHPWYLCNFLWWELLSLCFALLINTPDYFSNYLCSKRVWFSIFFSVYENAPGKWWKVDSHVRSFCIGQRINTVLFLMHSNRLQVINPLLSQKSGLLKQRPPKGLGVHWSIGTIQQTFHPPARFCSLPFSPVPEPCLHVPLLHKE